MAFKPSLKKKRPIADAEVNLTPVMNLICVLIPLLLGAAKFVDLALLEYQTPVIQESLGDAAAGTGAGGSLEQLLELRVNVVDSAFEVSVFNATAGDNYSRIPIRTDHTYDYEALRSRLREIKERIVGPPLSSSQIQNPETKRLEIVEQFKYADGDQIRISADGDVPLQIIVKVLDASREFKDNSGVFRPLFPCPALGQIQ